MAEGCEEKVLVRMDSVVAVQHLPEGSDVLRIELPANPPTHLICTAHKSPFEAMAKTLHSARTHSSLTTKN